MSLEKLQESESSTSCSHDDGLLTNFLSLFCRHRAHDRYITLRDDGWKTIKAPWNDAIIRKHLQQSCIIGLYPDTAYDLLIYDVDCKDAESKKTLSDRCSSIVRVVDAEPLIFTSSESNGRRICYFLDQPCYRDDIYAFARNLLTQNNLPIRDGYIEVMANRKADRLAFGKGSFVVDPLTLDPVYDLSLPGMIQHAQAIKDRSRLVIDGLDAHRKVKSVGKDEFGVTVELLENYGLPFGISTNEALLMLNRKQMGVLRQSPENAARWLKSWIRNHHNDRSKRINNGKWNEIDGQIDRIVQSFDPSRYNTKSLTSIQLTKKLALNDVVQLCADFFEGKLLQAAFSLLVWVKNRGILAKSIDQRNTNELQGAKLCLIRNNYLARIVDVWSCQIPKEAFRNFSGFQKNNPATTVKRLTEKGLIALALGHSTIERRCRTYHVFFTFDTQSQEVVSLDEALGLLERRQDPASNIESHSDPIIQNEGKANS